MGISSIPQDGAGVQPSRAEPVSSEKVQMGANEVSILGTGDSKSGKINQVATKTLTLGHEFTASGTLKRAEEEFGNIFSGAEKAAEEAYGEDEQISVDYEGPDISWEALLQDYEKEAMVEVEEGKTTGEGVRGEKEPKGILKEPTKEFATDAPTGRRVRFADEPPGEITTKEPATAEKKEEIAETKPPSEKMSKRARFNKGVGKVSKFFGAAFPTRKEVSEKAEAVKTGISGGRKRIGKALLGMTKRAERKMAPEEKGGMEISSGLTGVTVVEETNVKSEVSKVIHTNPKEMAKGLKGKKLNDTQFKFIQDQIGNNLKVIVGGEKPQGPTNLLCAMALVAHLSPHMTDKQNTETQNLLIDFLSNNDSLLKEEFETKPTFDINEKAFGNVTNREAYGDDLLNDLYTLTHEKTPATALKFILEMHLLNIDPMEVRTKYR